MDAAIEGWRKPEEHEHADVEGQKRFLRGRPRIQGRQETHGDVEHGRLRLVVRYALTNHGQGGTRRPYRLEVTKDVEKGLIDRHALQMSELAATRTEVRLHDHIGLKRTAESPPTPSRATGKRSDLSVVLGQECDDSVGVAIVDRT